MSTAGQAIGAIGGAIIGGIIGGPAGAQFGYAIGSAIGGYVDPTKTSGPRLTDAQNQTSTVGGVIPFGYGTYTCAGNIIWVDRLIEHKKTERVGKGGGQKNTTYTYTRSYAIGISETISSYVWIKKNGKLVYAANPASLGAAMGWTSKQISDLAAASNKFLQMATLYYGTASQMPDSTIVAVEGVGNVSPFRDLAYIVLENEDLTDTQGAVSQYEFCVNATPPEAYLTSKPYAQYLDDSMRLEPIFLSSSTRALLIDWPQPAESLSVEPQLISAGTRPVQWAFSQYPEMLAISPSFIGANTKKVFATYIHPPEDALAAVPNFIGASTKQVLYQTTIPYESLAVTPNFIGASTS